MPLSVKLMACNGACASCYETRIREANKDQGYDIEAILKTIDAEAQKCPDRKNQNAPCVHGGEPLLIKVFDLEKILGKIYGYWGRTSIQTNGTILTDAHIQFFKKYRTSVGVSIDGDSPELNYGRWNARDMSLCEIKKMTELVLENMRRLKDAGISLSVITLLRKYNASRERLPDLIDFLLRLRDEFGILWVRTNEVIVYDEARRAEEELTPGELANAFCKLADVAFSDPDLKWEPYDDIMKLFSGNSNATCVFTECDPWRTQAERTIEADGSIGGCLKSGAGPDGIQALAADSPGCERYRILPAILQTQNGCKGCDYWPICKGGCPGAGFDNDWRNKTRFCEAWKALFDYVLHKRLARFIIDKAYAKEKQVQQGGHGDVPHGDRHGDHWDRR